MASRKDPYENIYQDGVDRGFHIMHARQYAENGDGLKPRLEQTMETPWSVNGNPVIAYSVTNLENKRDKDGLRDTNMVELHEYKDGTLHLLDAVGKDFRDQNGMSVSRNTAREDVRQFASSASEYPHVFMYDEYMESRNFTNGRLGLDPPKPEDYEGYLESVEKQMMSRTISFVGAIEKPSQMHEAYESSPIVQAEMRDAFSSCHDTEYGA